MDDTTPTVYVRRLRPAKGKPPGWCLHGRRDCPALVVVADTQIDIFHGNAGAAMDAYSDLADRRSAPTCVFLLCTCLITDPAAHLPTRPPLHARITVERNPDGTC
mgnify:CR=1 FL=1